MDSLSEQYKKSLPRLPKVVETEKALYIDGFKLTSVSNVSYEIFGKGPVKVTVELLAESLAAKMSDLYSNSSKTQKYRDLGI